VRVAHPATLPTAGPAGKPRCRYGKFPITECQFPSFYFHDVTGAGHIAKNNGLFPAVPGFDLATGIGTIKMTPFITGFF
jgi:hypothetical protein